MGTLQADMQARQREIGQVRQEIVSLHAGVGIAVAEIGDRSALTMCHAEYEAFHEVDEAYGDAVHSVERLRLYCSQLDDRSRKIRQIEADIKALQVPLRERYARLGAIAYEAYGAGRLSTTASEVCDSFFREHWTQVRNLESHVSPRGERKDTGASLRSVFSRVRLERLRRKMPPHFAKVGAALVKAGCESTLPGDATGALVKELRSLAEQRMALAEELSVHRSAVAKMRNQAEKESPKSRLEAAEGDLERLAKRREEKAALYGEALHDALAGHADPAVIGREAVRLLDRVTELSHRIAALEREIVSLRNLMKVQDIEAQIAVENQQVEHLEEQIAACNRQIDQIHRSIDEKRRSIEAILPKDYVLP